MAINVFTNYYKENNLKRMKEMDFCFNNNYKNKHIKNIVIESQDRLKYSDYFKFMENYGDEDGVNIICNADIAFDDSIQLAEQIESHQVYALNRWNPIGSKIKHYTVLGSSDVWVFRGIPKDIYGDFYLGWWGCDGRIGYEIMKSGYDLVNPSFSIKTIHMHQSNIRNYSSQKNQVKGPYAGAPACYINDLILGGELNITRPGRLPTLKNKSIRKSVSRVKR